MFKNQMSAMLGKPNIVDMLHTAREIFESTEEGQDY